MDFDFSAAQYELAKEARRFLEAQCPASLVREMLDDPAAWSREVWKQMAELGWMALPFPEEHGGLGQSFLDLVLLLGELGRALAPVPYLASVVLAGHAILRHGSAEQRARWLPGIASGERIGTLAFSSDAIEARRSGSEWRVSGAAPIVLEAPAADLLVVEALTEAGPNLFVVEEGFSVSPRAGYDLTRCIGSVSLDGASGEPLEVPGTEEAYRVAVAAVCAEMIGVAQRILDASVEYAKVREQFGRPIGSFQAIKHKLAEMATELEAARSATSYACWAVATVAPDADLAVSIAKSYGSDACGHLAGEGIQVHGGIAYTWEHDMHLYVRRIKSLEACLGDAVYHRERIARLIEL